MNVERMSLDQRLQVMQAASAIFAARISSRSVLTAANKTSAIQPPTDDDILKQSIELVLRGLANKDAWPKPGSAAFHALNF